MKDKECDEFINKMDKYKMSWNLSDCFYVMHGVKVLQAEHVAEFIKKLKEEVLEHYDEKRYDHSTGHLPERNPILNKIDKLAGDELI